MITTFFINLAFFIANAFISIFPVGSGFPTPFHSAFQNLGSYIQATSSFLPLGTLFICLSLLFTAEVAIFGFRTFRWIISHIPFIGGKG